MTSTLKTRLILLSFLFGSCATAMGTCLHAWASESTPPLAGNRRSITPPLRFLPHPHSTSPAAAEEWRPSCQPELFDPNMKRSGSLHDGWTTVVENGESYEYVKNGSARPNDRPVVLKKPYQLDYYLFGCASDEDAVIEIKKSGKRQSLFTHVESDPGALSRDKRFLFLANRTMGPDRKWHSKRRIVDIHRDRAADLPADMDCVSSRGFWNGNVLITHSDQDVFPRPADPATKVCLWDDQARLLFQLDADFTWGVVGNGMVLWSAFGLLPEDDRLLYVIQPGNALRKEKGCHLFLQKLTPPFKGKAIKLSDRDDPSCASDLQVDTRRLLFDAAEIQGCEDRPAVEPGAVPQRKAPCRPWKKSALPEFIWDQ